MSRSIETYMYLMLPRSGRRCPMDLFFSGLVVPMLTQFSNHIRLLKDVSLARWRPQYSLLYHPRSQRAFVAPKSQGPPHFRRARGPIPYPTFTTQPLASRNCCVCFDIQSSMRKIRDLVRGKSDSKRTIGARSNQPADGTESRIIAVFGQGAQWAAMGADILSSSPSIHH
ncbi:hypothetical protein B0I35DRAFT_494876 [Stachybotrys elegans]|uniref:Uncharacterized protein n=1 Tax=Stachybotrys elegans TaxID=80388 RepID=A0A8K0WJN7_9HYPO|nr:hypothetical protein B0I35DRAFT_494876 [Stachybotrys elegans]